jgi:hypothetical protein
MFDFHTDNKKVFEIQLSNILRWTLPFVQQDKVFGPVVQLLAKGFGQGSLLGSFSEAGCFALVWGCFNHCWKKQLNGFNLKLLPVRLG